MGVSSINEQLDSVFGMSRVAVAGIEVVSGWRGEDETRPEPVAGSEEGCVEEATGVVRVKNSAAVSDGGAGSRRLDEP